MMLSRFFEIILPFILMGLLFAGVGIYSGWGDVTRKKRCTVPINAVVIENKKIITPIRSTGRRGYKESYAPVFQYSFYGRGYTVQSSYRKNPPAFSVGEETVIYIDPFSPQTFFLPQDYSQLIIMLLFTFPGFFILFTFIYLLIE